MRRLGTTLVIGFMAISVAAAQTPQPFPGRANPPRPAPAPPVATPKPPGQPIPSPPPPPVEAPPTEAVLGFPVYPSAQFIASYDAGRGQRYYLYGSELPFATLVKYYQSTLKNRGILVYDAPAIQVFEIGRFREETMAYPPGVTIKDYMWNNSPGYLNPKKDGKPARFASVIQIVPQVPEVPR